MMPGARNQRFNFRFKLVYTELVSSCNIFIPPGQTNFTFNEFMNITHGARSQIINDDNIDYDIVISGQPRAELSPPIQSDDISEFNFEIHDNSASFYIRPKNNDFVEYLRENCPNTNLTHNLSVSDQYELLLHRNREGAQADTGDDEPEPPEAPQTESLNENMSTDSDNIPNTYNGTCCICYEVRELSDHWQCYIPEGANRHGICDQCFQNYRSSSSRANDCPVCRQPLGNTNYGEVAPTTRDNNSHTIRTYIETIDPPEPQPSILQDFHYGGSGAAGPQDQEDAAGPGPPNSNHQTFLSGYNNYDTSYNSILRVSDIYDYINNSQYGPQIEVRNQDIIIRNIPYNEMVNLQSHNPNNNSTTTNNDDIANALRNVINRQINNLINNNRLNTSIFNSTFYNTDNRT